MLLSPIRSPIRSPLYSPLAKGGGGITLASIFATGGMLKSVNYLDRQFQDSTGTTAVSANDNPVGLALGYAQWGGKTLAEVVATQPELVTNGGFDTDTIWIKGTGWSIAGGKASYSGALAANTLAQAVASATNKKAYKVSGEWEILVTPPSSSAQVSVNAGGTGENIIRASPTNLVQGQTGILAAIAAPRSMTSSMSMRWGTLQNHQLDYTLDNVSAKEIPGSHGLQTTTNFRPVYKTAENGHWFFDGSDDSWLDTFLMGQEGMLAFDGTPTGTSDVFIGAKDTTNGNGYLGNNASGVICGAVGSDGFSTIVDSTGTDRSNTRILALLKWSATANLVQLKVDNVLVYSGPKNGAVSTTVPIREGALNNNGTAGSFFAGKAKMFYAHNRFTTDAEDTAVYQQRII